MALLDAFMLNPYPTEFSIELVGEEMTHWMDAATAASAVVDLRADTTPASLAHLEAETTLTLPQRLVIARYLENWLVGQ